MASALTLALVGFASAIAGGLIQALGTGRFEQKKFERQAKWDLYTAYFVALGDLSFNHPASEAHRQALANIAQIRGRIALVGSTEVVCAVGRVFSFPNLSGDDAQLAMADALSAMRLDIALSQSNVQKSDLQKIMFNTREPFL